MAPSHSEGPEPSEEHGLSGDAIREFQSLQPFGPFSEDAWQHLMLSGQEPLEARPVFSPTKRKSLYGEMFFLEDLRERKFLSLFVPSTSSFLRLECSVP